MKININIINKILHMKDIPEDQKWRVFQYLQHPTARCIREVLESEEYELFGISLRFQCKFKKNYNTNFVRELYPDLDYSPLWQLLNLDRIMKSLGYDFENPDAPQNAEVVEWGDYVFARGLERHHNSGMVFMEFIYPRYFSFPYPGT